jgi:hypothetical protein
MGMDVYGLNPSSEHGKYFRSSVWFWRPLAEYCIAVAPAVSGRCASWQTNDGEGLDDTGSRDLAAVLGDELSSGRTAKYVEDRDAELNEKPLETCDICQGTGDRLIDGTTSTCNGCNGMGDRKSWSTNYGLYEEDVRDFHRFLQDSGGFGIW